MIAFPSRELLASRAVSPSWLETPSQRSARPFSVSAGRSAVPAAAPTASRSNNSPFLQPNQGLHANFNVSLRADGAKNEHASIFYTAQPRTPAFRNKEYRPIGKTHRLELWRQSRERQRVLARLLDLGVAAGGVRGVRCLPRASQCHSSPRTCRPPSTRPSRAR